LIRFFDIFFSLFGLVLLSPLFLILVIWIKLDSKGPVLFKQIRVGRYGIDFTLFKFRSMFRDSDKSGLLTVGSQDVRITRSGTFIRKYKLDELPQLINVLKGDMSLVGPRPEVRRYVDLYNMEQKSILSYKPGITDYASIIYRNENELLSKAVNPEEYYIKHILPEKLKLNMEFTRDRNLTLYFKLVFLTILSIVGISGESAGEIKKF
jgi:lipopolysaccharide/colanic/teichoic acid biosynthesis glycosyltransferase